MTTIPTPTATTATTYVYVLDPPAPAAQRYTDKNAGIIRVAIRIDHANGTVARDGYTDGYAFGAAEAFGHVLNAKGVRLGSSTNDRRYVTADFLAPFVADAEARFAADHAAT